ncbi:MAG TPA: helix-turn-helix domain-containing protein [Actinomycetota bacterium]
MDALLSVKEAARLLGVSSDLVYLLAKGGELPSVRIGTGARKARVLFRPADLEAFVSERAA